MGSNGRRTERKGRESKREGGGGEITLKATSGRVSVSPFTSLPLTHPPPQPPTPLLPSLASTTLSCESSVRGVKLGSEVYLCVFYLL